MRRMILADRSRYRLLFLSLLLFFISVSIRVALYADFPIYLTHDSDEYLDISKDIYTYFYFFTPSLGVWRLPVYPVFLSLVGLFSALDSSSIVTAQILVDVGSILIGCLIGYLLRSPGLIVAMVLFLGLNPVYLLNEHLIMTEGIFLFCLLGLAVVALVCLQGKAGLLKGILLGIAFGLTILTRANGLFLSVPLVGGLIIILIRRRQLSVDRSRLLRFILGLSCSIMIFWGAWLWRNWLAFGRVVPFTYNSNINSSVYLSQHDLFDTSLPQISVFQDLYDPQRPDTVYDIVWKLREDIIQGEDLARSLVYEQLTHQPLGYFREAFYALVHFEGFPVPNAGYGRNDVHWWFENMVSDVAKVHALNASLGWYTPVDSAYIDTRNDTWLTQAWSKAGMLYILPFRAILFTLFSSLLIWYLVRHRTTGSGLAHISILLFSASYLFNALIHAITLADYDRFAAPFDWIMVMVICLICANMRRRYAAPVTASAPSWGWG